MYVNETWHICSVVLICSPESKSASIAQMFWTYYNPKFEKWKDTKKSSRYHIEVEKACGFIPCILCQTENMTKSVSLVFLLSRNDAFRHFLVNLSNGCYGNDDRFKYFNFSFRYIFTTSINLQSFITINLKWQEKRYQ